MLGRGNAGLTGLVILLLVPGAVAAEANGEFTLDGPLTLPPDSTLRFDAIVALDNDTGHIEDFLAEAPLIDVTLHEQRFIGSAGNIVLRSEQTSRTWTQTSATLRLIPGGDHAGYLGLRSAPGTASSTLASSASVESRLESRISTAMGTTRSDAPETPAFTEYVTGKHLYLKARADMLYEGDVTLKIDGLDLEVTAAENQTPVEWRTGRIEVSPAEVVRRWFVLEIKSARMHLAPGSAPVEIAGRSAPLLMWDGEARFQPTQGVLGGADGNDYVPTGERVTLAGRFTAHLAPSDSPGVALLTGLQGEVQATTLRLQPAPFSPLRSSTWNPWIVGLAAAVFTGGGVGAAWWVIARREKRNRESWTAEECHDYAGNCKKDGEFRRALTWARRGRKLAPSSAALAADEAECLARLGRTTHALKAYAEADELAPHGEYAIEAARLMASKEYPAEAIEDRLTRALAKSPDLLPDVERDFRDMLNRPKLAEAATAARREETPQH